MHPDKKYHNHGAGFTSPPIRRRKLVGGFTLVEAIVVIAITVTLLGVLTTYSRNGEGQILFFKEEATLVNTITRAKFFAFDAYQPTLQPTFDIPDPLVSDITERVCAWGVHFDAGADTYTLFRDLDLSWPTVEDCSGSNKKYDFPNEAFEVFELDTARIELSCTGLSPGSCEQGGSYSVVFTPPVPSVTFSSGFGIDSLADDLMVTLSLKDGTRETTVVIGKGGQISTE